MGFRIKTNLAALEAQHHLKQSGTEQSKEFSKLSSGKRITKAADDAAGLAVATKLNSINKGLKQASRNANDGISLIQVAEGGLNETSALLTRMRELTIQSASDTLGDVERSYLDEEFQQITEEIQRISQATKFNGLQLISGDNEAGTMDFHVGAFAGEENIVQWESDATDATASGLGVDGLDIREKDNALDSIEDIDGAIERVSGYRATLGAVQSRLQSTISNLETQHLNQENARANIEDADIAEASANLASANVAKQAGVSVLAQANNIPHTALRLLG